jgi:hypothetical protein
MAKRLLLLILFVNSNYVFAQTLSFQQKLYYTCKVWGFVKYYHSNVSNCNVNWDSVLLHVLPGIKNTATNNAFYDELDTMLAAAGQMQLSSTYFPDTLPAFLKTNRNWGWIDSSAFRADVQTQLDTIRNNFRPHPECHVEINPDPANGGYLTFPADVPLLNVNTYYSYPDEYNRLLLLFKYWNIIHYFNPYNYVIDKPIDTLLYEDVMRFDTASTDLNLYLAIKRLNAGLDDAHVDGETESFIQAIYNGVFLPSLALSYIQDKYVIVKSGISNIPIGDYLVSVNGLTIAQWEDSMVNYISAGNTSVFHRYMCDWYLLRGPFDSLVNITYSDTLGNTHDTTLKRTQPIDGWAPQFYYPADSLSTISWTTLPCGIGYVNNGNISIAGADSAYAALQNAQTIIIDLRNYPSSDGPGELMGDMLPEPAPAFAKYTLPDITYPGTFYWNIDSAGGTPNPTPYKGTVILLFNEETQSAAETDCMIYSTLPHVIKVGSQTAGADGEITYFDMSQEIQTGYSSGGMYYPNGDSMQRIGIVPDSVVRPTIRGIMQGRDEVLEKALAIAGCNLSVQNMPPVYASIKVYPNPANDLITIEGTNINTSATISITDITGRLLLQKQTAATGDDLLTNIDIRQLAAGMYIVTVQTDETKYITKIVKD